MRVAILGSGPAGLMAAQGVLDAHSAAFNGALSLMLISMGKKSPLYGAQYLHSPIPGSPAQEPKHIAYTLRGSSSGYRRKVYGANYDGSVSPEDLEQEHMGWDIRATYDWLWDRWEHAITPNTMDPIELQVLVNAEKHPDLIISSIPRPVLCHQGHTFKATEVWAAGSAPELGISIPYTCPEDMVVCNGDDHPVWYRMSNVFGRTTVEWPGWLQNVPVSTASKVKKPLDTDCDCWSDSPVHVLFVGRYGRWEKGVLSHSAYWHAYREVERRLAGATAEAEA